MCPARRAAVGGSSSTAASCTAAPACTQRRYRTKQWTLGEVHHYFYSLPMASHPVSRPASPSRSPSTNTLPDVTLSPLRENGGGRYADRQPMLTALGGEDKIIRVTSLTPTLWVGRRGGGSAGSGHGGEDARMHGAIALPIPNLPPHLHTSYISPLMLTLRIPWESRRSPSARINTQPPHTKAVREQTEKAMSSGRW